jgi:hypothetical protein
MKKKGIADVVMRVCTIDDSTHLTPTPTLEVDLAIFNISNFQIFAFGDRPVHLKKFKPVTGRAELACHCPSTAALHVLWRIRHKKSKKKSSNNTHTWCVRKRETNVYSAIICTVLRYYYFMTMVVVVPSSSSSSATTLRRWCFFSRRPSCQRGGGGDGARRHPKVIIAIFVGLLMMTFSILQWEYQYQYQSITSSSFDRQLLLLHLISNKNSSSSSTSPWSERSEQAAKVGVEAEMLKKNDPRRINLDSRAAAAAAVHSPAAPPARTAAATATAATVVIPPLEEEEEEEEEEESCFLLQQEMQNLVFQSQNNNTINNNDTHHKDILWQGTPGLNQMVGFGFGGMLLCHELGIPSSSSSSSSSMTIDNTTTSSTVTTTTTTSSSWSGSSSSWSSATLRIEFNSQEAFEQVHGATGNQLLQFYGSRLAARATGHVDVHVHCPDALQHQDVFILPWITGYFPATTTRTKQRRRSDKDDDDAETISSSSSSCTTATTTMLPTVAQTCQAFLEIPIAYAIPDIRYDLRRMALSMMNLAAGGTGGGGSFLAAANPIISQAAREFQEKYLFRSNVNNDHNSSTSLEPPPHHGTMDVPFIMPPPPPQQLPAARSSTSSSSRDMKLDDVVIHFRCGDLMSLGHPDYCFVPYSSFARHISPHVQSIGIVTQAFEKNDNAWNRGVDVQSTTGLERCRVVVHDYQAYLQRAFPNATVTIHNNGPNESMTIAYTRMIMANQTFCMASTFPIFATLATFGHAYIHVPRYEMAPSRFLLSPQPQEVVHDKSHDNIHLLRDEPYIMAGDLIKMWKRPGGQGQDAVLEWFRQDPPSNTTPTTTTTTITRRKIGNVRARVSS